MTLWRNILVYSWSGSQPKKGVVWFALGVFWVNQAGWWWFFWSKTISGHESAKLFDVTLLFDLGQTNREFFDTKSSFRLSSTGWLFLQLGVSDMGRHGQGDRAFLGGCYFKPINAQLRRLQRFGRWFFFLRDFVKRFRVERATLWMFQVRSDHPLGLWRFWGFAFKGCIGFESPKGLLANEGGRAVFQKKVRARQDIFSSGLRDSLLESWKRTQSFVLRPWNYRCFLEAPSWPFKNERLLAAVVGRVQILQGSLSETFLSVSLSLLPHGRSRKRVVHIKTHPGES